MAKAATKAERIRRKRSRAGRPLAPNVPRTPSGQRSRSKEAVEWMTRLELEAATWKRRQTNPGITPEEARRPEYGSVIAKWLENHKRFVKKYGKDVPNPDEFTQLHYDTAMRYHTLYQRYLEAVEARRPRSASDYSPGGGYDGRDPFDPDLAGYYKAIETSYQKARHAVLESGPLGHMALQAIVIENREAESLRGDLRLALNRLAILWKMAEKIAA